MICTLLALYHFIAEKMAGNQERTYVMIKPDGVQRGLVGEIIKRFEVKGFKLVALKFTWVSSRQFLIISKSHARKKCFTRSTITICCHVISHGLNEMGPVSTEFPIFVRIKMIAFIKAAY